MKTTFFTTLLLLCVSTSFSQSFYKSIKNNDYKALISNGVHYIKTDNPEIDEPYIKAITEHWKVTKFEINESDYKPSPEDVIFIEPEMGSSTLISIIQLKELNENSINRNESICGITMNGFTRVFNKDVRTVFANQSIIALNDGIAIINENQISKLATSLAKEMNQAILPESKIIQNKTMLIVGESHETIHFKGLDASGIKYQKISFDEYVQLLKEEDLSDYCLYFCSENVQSDFSIFDFETNKMVYTKHFMNYKFMMAKPEFAAIVKSW
jgi:hypothetical protein